MKFPAALAIPFLVILSSCAQLPQPWPDSESGMKLANMTYIARDATPDEASIHQVFYAAYSRVRVGLMGGEDLEAINANLKELRTRLGDRGFAMALEKEDPVVRSGVGYFCGEVTQESFPLTRAILDKTPDYKFELEKMEESM